MNSEQCRRLLNLTATPGYAEAPDDESSHISLRCSLPLGHVLPHHFPGLVQTETQARNRGATLRLVK